MERREHVHHLFFTARVWWGDEEVRLEVGGTRQRGGVEVSIFAPDGWTSELTARPPRSDGDARQRKFRGRRV